MADIAAMLVQQPAQPEEVEEAVVAEDQEDLDTSDNEEEEDQSPDGGEEEEPEAEASDDEGDEQEDDESDEEADETDYLDVRDDDLITVMVDGEEQEISIGDLKKAHSLGGATEKRLQEATEARKAAISQQTKGLEALAAQEQVLLTALNGLDDNLFQGVIPAPDERMRQSNPEQYLRHKEAYDRDQKRIADAKKAIESKKEEVQRQRNERLQQFAQQAAEVIATEIPELADPKTAQQTFKAMSDTAMHYGYSQEEINAALDPRMFALVRDAMKYRQMTDKTRERNPKDLEGQKAKKVRRLRSGNTQAKTRARQSDKQRQQVRERARKTGKVADVAATLLVAPKG